MSAAPLLEVARLGVDFLTPRGPVHALRDVDLAVPRGGAVGIVGESGSGKSTLIAAAMRLLPDNAAIRTGRIGFEGSDVLALRGRALRDLRGRRIAMVFQDPMTALNPVLTIGRQMTDIQYRDRISGRARRARAAEMLRRVGIPDAASRLAAYPHQFSGGMRQRICIAMALLGAPALLIADEPTTALDVTTEAQIIHLLRALQAGSGTALLFISHNLGLVAELAETVVILYAGEVVERGPVRAIFHDARHPYTQALLVCDPALVAAPEGDGAAPPLPTIGGEPPDLRHIPGGCIFAARCPRRIPRCLAERPALRRIAPGHEAACHLAMPDATA